MVKLEVDTVEEAKGICAVLEMKYSKVRYYRTDNVLSITCDDHYYGHITVKNWLNGLAKIPSFYPSGKGTRNRFLGAQIEYHGKPS